MIIKGGMIASAPMGDPNASISNAATQCIIVYVWFVWQSRSSYVGDLCI